MGGTTAFYTYTTYMQKFPQAVGRAYRHADDAHHGALARLRADLQPRYGALSDKIGRKPLLIWLA
jgi:MHS family alpha-ketoglutarate permease-like MFS transporter